MGVTGAIRFQEQGQNEARIPIRQSAALDIPPEILGSSAHSRIHGFVGGKARQVRRNLERTLPRQVALLLP